MKGCAIKRGSQNAPMSHTTQLDIDLPGDLARFIQAAGECG